MNSFFLSMEDRSIKKATSGWEAGCNPCMASKQIQTQARSVRKLERERERALLYPTISHRFGIQNH